MAVLGINKYRWLYERLMETVNFYNNMYWNYRLPTNANSTLLEPIQFYKSLPLSFLSLTLVFRYDGTEQGHYNWHSDVGVKGLTAKRSMSVSVQLSPEDSYEVYFDMCFHEPDSQRALLAQQSPGVLFVWIFARAQ